MVPRPSRTVLFVAATLIGGALGRAGDITPPYPPSGLAAVPRTCYRVDLSWSPAWDVGGAGLAGYRIYRDGIWKFSTTSTSFTAGTYEGNIDTLAATRYTYAVSAVDAAGNESALSPPVVVTTPVCPDSPTVPAGVLAQPSGCRGVTLSWSPSASVDPEQWVVAYTVLRDGVAVGQSSVTSYGDWGLAPATTHRYAVQAETNRRIRSAPSPAVWLTQPRCADTTPPATPKNLRVSRQGGCTQFQFLWDPSTDTGGSGLRHYDLYEDAGSGEMTYGAAMAPQSLMAPLYGYLFQATAVDFDGNESSRSNLILVRPDCSHAADDDRMNAAVLLFNFPDRPERPFDLMHANSVVFTSTTSLNHFLQEASYGKAALSGRSYGWFTLPKALTGYCPVLTDGLGYACDDARLVADSLALARGAIDLSPYEQLILVYHGVGESGSGGGGVTQVSAETGFSPGSLAHEMGHNLGLVHAGSWQCDDGSVVGRDLLNPAEGTCTLTRYGDLSDPMGSSALRHYNAYHKELLGFLSPENVAVATRDGDYLIDALETASAGVQELRVPLSPKGYFYFLEYRKKIGFDGQWSGTQAPVEGVFVRLHAGRWPGTDADTLAVNGQRPIGVGAPFVDPQRRVRIDVLLETSRQALVTITHF